MTLRRREKWSAAARLRAMLDNAPDPHALAVRIAEACGVDEQGVYEWAQGRRKPDPHSAAILESHFSDVPVFSDFTLRLRERIDDPLSGDAALRSYADACLVKTADVLQWAVGTSCPSAWQKQKLETLWGAE